MEETTEATPFDGSLDAGASRLDGLLSQVEEKEKVKTKPEQVKPEVKAEPKQVQSEPDEPEIESAKPEDVEVAEPDPTQPKTVKAKDLATGEDVEVTEEEKEKGYLRVQDYTRKTQAHAEAVRKFQAEEVAAVRQERQQIQEMLEQLKPVLRPEEPDWATLKTQLAPEQYAERLETWRVQQNHLQNIEKQQAQIRERQEAEAARGFEQYVKDEQEKLAIELPAFREPEKARALKKELSTFAISRGFTEEDLGRVTDHRLVLLLNDAMEGQKAKAKAPEIKNKIERALATQAPGSRTGPAKDDKVKVTRERFLKSGRMDDAVAGLDALVSQVK